MAVNKSFNGTTYSIPTTAGENGWTSLTNFLQALADYAAVKTTKVQAIRTATTSPITVSATSDFAVNVALSVAGVSTVTLPVGASGQMFCIIDGNGDSATYNITVQGSSSQTINGASTYVMASNKQVAIFQFNGTEWKVIAEYLGASINATKIGAGSVDNTEFAYLNGVTSAIQTQLNTGATNLTTHAALTSAHGTSSAVVGINDSQTLTNKTLTSPTLTTPVLGTPSSGTLTNCTGLPIVAGTTGTLSVARGGTGLTAVGSALQVLRTNAGATALEFASVGSGDVVGPASATDNAIARFDGTTGKLVQNSDCTISDTGAVTLGPNASTATNCVVNGAASVTHGVVFPASQNAVANANTLDDYEEGTWTPNFLWGGAASGIIYGNRVATYTKIGNRVFFHMFVDYSARGSSTGNFTITGLPFTSVVTASGGHSAVAIWFSNVSLTNYVITGYVSQSSTTIFLNASPINTSAGSTIAITDTAFPAANGGFMITGHYITA
jgi:hypothetical protein